MSKGSTDLLLGDKTSDNTNFLFAQTLTSTFTTPITTSSTTDSSSTTTGSIQTLGGLGIAKSLTTGGKLIYTGKTSFSASSNIIIPVTSVLTSDGASMTIRIYLKSNTDAFTLTATDDTSASLTNRLSSYLNQQTATLINTANTDSLTGSASLSDRPQHLVLNIGYTSTYIVVDISGQLFLQNGTPANIATSHFHWTGHSTDLGDGSLVLTSSVANSLTGFWVVERITK